MSALGTAAMIGAGAGLCVVFAPAAVAYATGGSIATGLSAGAHTAFTGVGGVLQGAAHGAEQVGHFFG